MNYISYLLHCLNLTFVGIRFKDHWAGKLLPIPIKNINFFHIWQSNKIIAIRCLYVLDNSIFSKRYIAKLTHNKKTNIVKTIIRFFYYF